MIFSRLVVRKIRKASENISDLGYTLEWIRSNHLHNKNLPKNIWNKHIFSDISNFEWIDKVGL